MDRRHALAAIAALAAGPALAQSNPSSSSSSAGSTNASGSMADGMHQMGQAEMEHAMRTQQAGAMSLEMSRLAEQKARNEDVKQFAKFEAAEQETVADVLKSMRDPSSTSSTAMGGSDDKMNAKAQAAMQKLQKASGAEFDKEYIQAQIDGHKELLDIQQDYLKNGKNREHVNLAKMASNQIREHLTILQDMEKDMGKKRG